MRNRTYGGVRGRKTKVGRKLLRFPPTRLAFSCPLWGTATNSKVKLGDFCRANNVSETSFKKWLKQYEEAGIEGLARADAEIGNILPEGVDKTKEGYKREILRLRIENERLKKKYLVRQNEDGQTEYVRLKMKSSK